MTKEISTLHTLGPVGTNCELAANLWFEQQGRKGKVNLYSTLEQAVEAIPDDPTHALMGCIVYPYLSKIVFKEIENLKLVDCLIMPTDEMLMASKGDTNPKRVAVHPAPLTLVEGQYETILANSNSHAALMCSEGIADACVTTKRALEMNGLVQIKSFGQLMMGFSVHQRVMQLEPAEA